MNKVPLSRGEFALVDSGDFELLSKYKWYCHISNKKKYASRKDSSGKSVHMHRFLTSPPKGMEVDHINGNGLDNRRSNLRVCTHAQNQRNIQPHKNTASGMKGVHKNGKRWRAQIVLNAKKIHLGYFDSVEDAHKAYKKASLELHGEFSWT